jgi:DNA-binding NarL/FixJ family response regulator
VTQLKVLIVEDDSFTRSTLAGSLAQAGFQVLDPASDVTEAIASFRVHRHDVLLVDLDLGPGPTGMDLVNLVRKSYPNIGVVFLTSFEHPRLKNRSHSVLPRASRYLVKQSVLDVGQIVSAIVDAHQSGQGSGSDADRPQVHGFTTTQLETMKLVARGLTNAEIAKQRFVTEKAIEKTIRLIVEQLELEPDNQVNLRVSIARAYLNMTGGKA